VEYRNAWCKVSGFVLLDGNTWSRKDSRRYLYGISVCSMSCVGTSISFLVSVEWFDNQLPVLFHQLFNFLLGIFQAILTDTA
jgi:hypothetical protein